MVQNPDTKRVNITSFQEVRLTESEFKHARELDSDELKNIRDEYFKKRHRGAFPVSTPNHEELIYVGIRSQEEYNGLADKET